MTLFGSDLTVWGLLVGFATIVGAFGYSRKFSRKTTAKIVQKASGNGNTQSVNYDARKH